MITKALLAAYKGWPLRPHCAPPRHVRLCRAFNWFLPPSMKCPEWDIPVPDPLPRR